MKGEDERRKKACKVLGEGEKERESGNEMKFRATKTERKRKRMQWAERKELKAILSVGK